MVLQNKVNMKTKKFRKISVSDSFSQEDWRKDCICEKNNHSQKWNTLKIGKIGFKIALKANNKVRSRISKTGGKRRNLSRIKRQTIKEGKI